MTTITKTVEVKDVPERYLLPEFKAKLAEAFDGEYDIIGDMLYSDEVYDLKDNDLATSTSEDVKGGTERRTKQDAISEIEFMKRLDKGKVSGPKIYACRFIETGITKKQADAERIVKETVTKRDDYFKKHALMNQSAAFFGCPICKSRIARMAFEKGGKGSGEGRAFDTCPVCGGIMNSKTDVKTIKGYNDKINKFKEVRDEEKAKHAKAKPTIKWLCQVSFPYEEG